MPAYSQLILEVDGNNVIKAAYPVGPEVQPTARSIHQSPQNSRPTSEGQESPIKWRLHDEVAIEVSAFKQPLILHDLVDPQNVEIMVMKKNHVIIQGSSNKQINIMMQRTVQSMGFPSENAILVYKSFFAEATFAKERLRRQGGLVDIHYKQDIVNEERATELMEKSWDIPSLQIMEIRVPDPSLPGPLKPGRRLIPQQEFFGDGTAAANTSNGHTQ